MVAAPRPKAREARPRRRASQPRLARKPIIEVALGLARAEGIAAVSMRRIADELETAPMSLYRHVTDRQDLLIGMLDVIAAGIEVPPRAEDPRTEIAGLIGAVHDALARDPWVVQALAVEQLASPLILPVVERLFDAMRRAGLSPLETVDAFGLLFQFVYGEVLSIHHDRGEAAVSRQIVRSADPVEFPVIGEVLASLPPVALPDFARNLQRALDGLLGR